MNKILSTFLISLMLVVGMSGLAVAEYDDENPYTVTMNFIVGADTSFTVSLAGEETTIDFEPTTMNSKNVEPNSQVASAGTPMVEITNTGNTDLDFKHKVTVALDAWVAVSFNNANTTNWAKTLSDEDATIAASVSADASEDVFFWANFTAAPAGSVDRTYQISSSVSE